MSGGNEEEQTESPQEATYNPVTKELSVRYPDGHTDSIIIDRNELTKVASRDSVTADDLDDLKKRQQEQQSDKKPEEEQKKD